MDDIPSCLVAFELTCKEINRTKDSIILDAILKRAAKQIKEAISYKNFMIRLEHIPSEEMMDTLDKIFTEKGYSTHKYLLYKLSPGYVPEGELVIQWRKPFEYHLDGEKYQQSFSSRVVS